MTGILTAKLDEAPLTAGEISNWLSAEKGEIYKPLNRDCRDHFSFSMHGIDGFGGWSGSSSTLRQFAVNIESDDFMFFMEHGTSYELATGGIRHHVTPGSGLLTSADRYSGITIGGGSVGEGFCVPREAVMAALVGTYERAIPAGFEFTPVQDLNSGPMAHMLNLIRFFRENICESQNLAASPIALASFKEMFCLLMVQNLHHSLSQSNLPVNTIAPRQLRRAMDFARMHAALPIGVADMAAAAGVSARALQVNFRRFLNTTPMSYLRQLRLEGARREMIEARPSATVAEIAQRWGFVHLGRFSQEYRAAFGVSPSSDLARPGLKGNGFRLN
ncbi:AraC family transcriptional regulator [Sinorhizobium glycinis]|uniref:AraC family transcriptional regulator n=1 Tax=Sinorhizobium glycinis TaxID=1472378 RepID=A0A178XPG1_9HYPH|nr:helix-turn-helix domain-containing protein [Sinorhizobium glycinis]OAP36683.1 AraC family transcriptional regulator [Sinorhizobium glycinis]